MRLHLLLVPALLLAGCVDTEFIDDPTPPVPPRLEAAVSTDALLIGQTAQGTARYFDDTGQESSPAGIVWTSSASSVASVSPEGTITALASGTTSIRATVTADGTESQPFPLVVVADATEPARVRIAPEAVELQPGDMQTLTATVSNVEGEALSGLPVSWTSERPSVATIDADGRVTASESGAAVIIASVGSVVSPPAIVTVPGQIRTGGFTSSPGSGYEVRGTATLSRQANGSLRLMLESDFVTDLGPAMAVYLSSTSGVDGMSRQVGTLTRSTGPFTYTINGVELDAFDYVVIQCVPFNVTFGSSRLN